METKLQSYHAALIFIGFFLITLTVAFIKKVFYFLRYKKRYYIFPRPSIKGIANISMIVALSVAILILLTIVTANTFSVLFRAFPGSRVTIEGILIKISGLLFGPFLGMIIGALTDLLAIIMTAGVFHYGYFIAAMAYGLISGMIRTIHTYSSKNKILYAFFTTFIAFVVFGLANVFIYQFVDNTKGLDNPIIPIFPKKIPQNALFFIVSGFLVAILFVIWFGLFFSNQLAHKKKNIRFQSKITKEKNKINRNYYIDFCFVLIAAITNELLINVLLMPSFDADLSTIGYDTWFLIRIFIFIPMIIANILIIYPVYTLITPLIKWDYQKEMLEDIKIPIYIK